MQASRGEIAAVLVSALQELFVHVGKASEARLLAERAERTYNKRYDLLWEAMEEEYGEEVVRPYRRRVEEYLPYEDIESGYSNGDTGFRCAQGRGRGAGGGGGECRRRTVHEPSRPQFAPPPPPSHLDP
jgi:hypothetical protein